MRRPGEEGRSWTTIHIYDIVIDCADPRRLADFWMRALDYQKAFATPQEIGIEPRDDPDDRLPALVFVLVPEPKQAKNRLHLDLNPSGQAPSCLQGLSSR